MALSTDIIDNFGFYEEADYTWPDGSTVHGLFSACLEESDQSEGKTSDGGGRGQRGQAGIDPFLELEDSNETIYSNFKSSA